MEMFNLGLGLNRDILVQEYIKLKAQEDRNILAGLANSSASRPSDEILKEINKIDADASEELETEPKFIIETPEIDISDIQKEIDHSLITSNLEAIENYAPASREIPTDRSKLKWDYKPSFIDTVESDNYKIVRGTPKDRRDQSYIAKRIRYPGVAAHFDKITKSIPKFNHNDLGPIYTDDQKRLHEYYMEIWPEPDVLDAIGLLKIK